MKKFILPKGRVSLLSFLFLLMSLFAQSQQFLTKIGGWNAYVHLPDDYATISKTYPVIIFAPGISEIGTDASKLLLYGPSKMIADGIWNGNTTISNVTTKFIVISIQPIDAYPQPLTISFILDQIMSAYRVDQNRLICTGISMGGFTWNNYSIDPSHPTYANRITALISMSAVIPNYDLTEFKRFAQAGGKMWAFQGVNDDSRKMGPIVDTMNKYSPGSSFYTNYTDGGGGHCCWNGFYDPSYRKIINGQSMNIYEWASLQFKQIKTSASSKALSISAGGTQLITLPALSVPVTAVASTPGGTISSALWTQVSGPSNAGITVATSLTTSFTGLTKGIYIFKVTVTDNSGAIASDNIQLTVNSATSGNGRRILMSATDGQVYNQSIQTTYNPQPGDTLVIPTSNLISFNISHFAGAPGNPIVIVPSDSSYIGGYPSYCGNITYARYFKITGFHFDGSRPPSTNLVFSNFGIAIGTQTDHYEACNLSIKNAGIGFCAKQNPDNSFPMGYYPNYVQDSIYIHDISVKRTATEGFYVGYTNDVTSPLASPINHLRADHLYTDSTGWDGVQLSDCQNVYIHDIQINHYGLTNSSGQQNGMLFGGEVTLKDSAYNINVSNGTGAGLLILGRQLFKVTDVILTNTATTSGESAIYVSDVADLGYNLSFLQLDLRRITVNGASKYALNNANNNGTTLPGHVRGLKYSNTGMTIHDLIDVFDTPVLNTPPVVNAGIDLTITLPVSSTTLNGSAIDADGTIAGYNWTKISGPSAFTISSASTAAPLVTNLVAGAYVFRLTVTDNGRLTAYDDVTVLVNPAIIVVPVANAGSDLSITLPVNSVTLNGSASSPSTGIVSYSWIKTEGPSQFTIAASSTVSTVVNNLVAGTYKFQLVVKDATGKTGSATVSVVVNNSIKPAPTNIKPTSIAGPDQIITLPLGSVVLDGKGSYDPDGYILRYYWMKIKGSGGYITNTTSMTTNVTGLKEGSYTFTLYVTDNNGNMATSNVTVIVKAALKNASTITTLNSQDIRSLVTTKSIVTGKQSDTEQRTLVLYPNPTENDLHIRYYSQSSERLTLIIYDVQGRPVINKDFIKNQPLFEKEINVSSLKPGSYYVTIIPQNKEKTTSLIIKK